MDVWVYMLRCSDGSYYVGSARCSLDNRIGLHHSGELGGYTSTRRPVALVWSVDFQSITDAIAFERQLKGWSRAKKEALIRGDFTSLPRLASRAGKKKDSSFETRAGNSPRAPQDEVGFRPKRGTSIPISLIVAVAQNGVIGVRGALPWRLPEDLKHFKALTLGKPVIMGRKTWDSLPRKPLPGRSNIVVTRDHQFRADGALVAHSLTEAIEIATREQPAEIAVIGGEAIFAAALPLAHRIHWTAVEASPEGDAFMPPFDKAEWQEVAREGPFEEGDLRYVFITLERRQLGQKAERAASGSP
jgi:dihydrofolate reductase